jgi:hypothetical protein
MILLCQFKKILFKAIKFNNNSNYYSYNNRPQNKLPKELLDN